MHQPAKREMTFLLAQPERRLLRAMARRLPAWVVPDLLTVVGVVGALGTAAGYALSTYDPAWLWLASGMLVLNWYGDSLDGTLARVRGIERPRYGYYLDHGVDAFTTVVIGAGIGLSPYVSFEPAVGLVIVYLLLSINVYLESNVFGVFRLAYGRFGPTEVRILLIVANTLLIVGARAVDRLPVPITLVADLTFGAVAAIMFVLVVVRFGGNLRTLGRADPPGGGA